MESAHEKAITFAQTEMLSRLNGLPVRRIHDPLCDCWRLNRNKRHCPNRVQIVVPTDYCIQPMKDYKIASTEMYRRDLKKLMQPATATAKPKQDHKPWVFVTVNPDPKKNIELKTFRAKLEHFLKTTVFADHLAVLEQRGTTSEDNIGKGQHAHILFKRKTPLSEGLPPAQIRRQLKNSWRNYCDTTIDGPLDIQLQTDEEAFDNVQYMVGTKFAPGKAEKQEGDQHWRIQNDLPQFFGNKNLI